jgi:hypothetical protein
MSDERCTDCESCDPLQRHNHVRELSWPSNGGTASLQLPHRNGITVGRWVERSPIPGTPPWEWVIYNMPVTVVTGMSAGYTRWRWQSVIASKRALRFWRDLGYVTGETP